MKTISLQSIQVIFSFSILFVILQNSIYAQKALSKGNCTVEKDYEERIISPKKPLKVSFNDYLNLDIVPFKKASQYDFLELQIDSFQDENQESQLYITFQDHLTQNYWSQLNHISHLSKGKNIIFVDLKSLVGERGSQKEKRNINFKKLKKVFLVVDPEKTTKGKIELKSLKLIKSARPNYPSAIKVFDFRIKDDSNLPCVQAIDEKDRYHPKLGYGFKDISLWKKEDSVYMDTYLRSVLYIQNGEFAVDLPNGHYELILYWNSLGYWDPPFYSSRKVLAEDIPLLISDRSLLSNYEDDLLIFENREPSIHDHPWDWLYKDIMKPIRKKVKVTDGQLNLKFSGDASGVGLNGLIIAKANPSQSVLDPFLIKFKNMLKGEYNRKIRSFYPSESPWQSKKNFFHVSSKIERMSPYDDLSLKYKNDKALNEILFAKNFSSFINLLIHLKYSGTYKMKIDWIPEGPRDLSVIQLKPYKSYMQWLSRDRNHESYTLETQYLVKGDHELQGSQNQQFFIEFAMRSQLKDTHPFYKQKIFKEKGVLKISFHSKDKSKKGNAVYTKKLPLTFVLLNDDFDKLTTQVGFIGLNALKYSYFPNQQSLERRRHWDMAYLSLLSRYGFNAFTGLPRGENEPLGLSFGEVDQFLKKAKKLGFRPPYHTYGGEFLHKFFEESSADQILQEKSSIASFFESKKFENIIFQFSDEPGGYSQNIKRDSERYQFLKKNFPFLSLGGFTQWKDGQADSLVDFNKKLDWIALSSLGHSGIHWLQSKNRTWGLYNQAENNRDDLYHVFGRKLWNWSRKEGFSFYLEWHSSAIQNMPYFDLDGREADVAIGLPNHSGGLNPTIRFIQAAEGLQDFLWLQYLSSKKAFKAQEFLILDEKFTFRNKILRAI